MERHEGDLYRRGAGAGTATRDKDEAAAAVSARVLFIDDEVALGITLERALDEHRFTLETNARAALERLRSDTDFDVLLCDLMLPDLSGMDFHAEVSRLHPGLEKRIVFVTGGAFSAAAQSFLDAVSNRCIEKPFDLEMMEQLLREYAVARRGAGA